MIFMLVIGSSLDACMPHQAGFDEINSSVMWTIIMDQGTRLVLRWSQINN